jgi:hypothetical protein
MPKIVLHPWIKEISGKMGDVVFKRTPSGEIIMTKSPDMTKVKWSPAQQAHRRRFKKASAYAKAAMADPKVSTIYKNKAKKAHKRPRDLAISDYFKGKNLLAKKTS